MSIFCHIWLYPLKKILIKSILLIDSVSFWNLCCCIGIVFLLYTGFFSENQCNLFLFWINMYLLFILNSYYVIAIKNALSKVISFLLLPLFLLPVLPVYLLLYGSALCTILILFFVFGIFYSNIYIIIHP